MQAVGRRGGCLRNASGSVRQLVPPRMRMMMRSRPVPLSPAKSVARMSWKSSSSTGPEPHLKLDDLRGVCSRLHSPYGVWDHTPRESLRRSRARGRVSFLGNRAHRAIRATVAAVRNRPAAPFGQQADRGVRRAGEQAIILIKCLGRFGRFELCRTGKPREEHRVCHGLGVGIGELGILSVGKEETAAIRWRAAPQPNPTCRARFSTSIAGSASRAPGSARALWARAGRSAST